MLNRRRILGLGAAVGGAAVALPLSGVLESVQATQRVTGTRVRNTAYTPFTTQMPVPSILRPTWTGANVDMYELALQPARVEMLPGVLTEIMSYGGSYVGPTIKARSGRKVQIRYKNQFPMGVNVHLHGGHVAQSSDGYPTSLIQPGATQLYEYPNQQRGTTLWYHDHTHMMEAEHVYRGLHGFYLLEDPDEQRLNLPTGKYDVPIMLSDAHFDDNGALIYGMGDALNRTTILANGKPVPFFPVCARKYRLRLVNASTWRFFRLSLAGRTVTQIGSDGGLLPAPLPLTQVVISPGERIELVVDFSADAAGTQVILDDLDGAGSVLRFDVGHRAWDSSQVPNVLRPLAVLPPATAERHFELKIDVSTGVPLGVINGKVFDANRVDTSIRQGTTEDWLVYNADTDIIPGGLHHNFHSHLVQFRVIDRDGKPPLVDESGLKDTVRIAPGETVRLRATFGGFQGRFPYHCHLIEHSAMGMMAQMEITP
jgi:FtsP/CotA-like multicopper oxidase with cupredoxin domain